MVLKDKYQEEGCRPTFEAETKICPRVRMGAERDVSANNLQWLMFEREHHAARRSETSVRINCLNRYSVIIPCSCCECGLS